MGRLHSKGKGIASSSMPYKRTAPAWQKSSPEEIEDQVCKLAKKGMRPSAIGVTLRDSLGVPMVGAVTGSKILRILKKNGMAPEVSWRASLPGAGPPPQLSISPRMPHIEIRLSFRERLNYCSLVPRKGCGRPPT